MNQDAIDAQFPQAEGLCYLNHAAVSPWPLCTQQAVVEFAQQNVQLGATHYPQWMKVEQHLRQQLATLINAKGSHEIALAKSTSEALSIIAYGLEWQAGDEIIISNQEFPSNRIVWQSLAEQGVIVIEAPLDTLDPVAAIAQHISPATRLISISSVQYATGLRLNLRALGELCRQRQVLLCIDAIQSLGTQVFDQQEIQADFIVADGHKWMMAAEGLALLYVKEAHIKDLRLHQYGWHMVADKGNYDSPDWRPADDATRFECGSPNMLGIHALNASLKLLLSLGIDHIQSALQSRIDYLLQGLNTLPGIEILSPTSPDLRAGIVTFRPALPAKLTHLRDLHAALMKEQVICAYRGGGIRFSPAFYTSDHTLDLALERLKALLQD